MIEFTVYGEPKGKGRPKFRNTGKFVTTYTPKDTVSYENLVKFEFLEQTDKKKIEGELFAEINAYFSIPKSTSKKKAELMRTGEIMHTKLSDCDNIAKIILDALNKIAYHDDSQICSLTVKKFYSDTPRVEVKIWERE